MYEPYLKKSNFQGLPTKSDANQHADLQWSARDLKLWGWGGGGGGDWRSGRRRRQGVPGSRPGWVAVRCGLEQVTFTQEAVDVRLTWTGTGFDEAGD